MEPIPFLFTLEEAQTIGRILEQAPYNQVASILAKMQAQVTAWQQQQIAKQAKGNGRTDSISTERVPE